MMSLLEMTDIARHRLCEAFLFDEAQRLDSDDVSGWLQLLSPDLKYRVPLPRQGEGPYEDQPLLASGAYLEETYTSIRMRAERLGTGHAWVEEPRSRTCRIVANTRVGAFTASDVSVRSNFMLYRTFGDSRRDDFLCGERRDRLVVASDVLQLAERVVLLTQSTLQSPSLGVFI